jgi:hypothetical protein
MTEAELERIEAELAVQLPAEYRAAMLGYSIPACAGNDDTELWDNAPRLIELNRELRTGRYSIKPWPAEFFAVGRDAGGCSQALNLRDGSVLWADRGHLPHLGGTPSKPIPFAQWCPEYLAGLRSDLEGDGIDPDGSPEAARQVEERNRREGDRTCCGATLVVLILTAVAVALAMRIRG